MRLKVRWLVVWPTSAFDPLQSGTSLPSTLPNPQEGLFVRDHFYQIAVSTIFRMRGRTGLYLKRGLRYSRPKTTSRAFFRAWFLFFSILSPKKTFWPQNQFFSTFPTDHDIWSIFQKNFKKFFSIFFFRFSPFSSRCTKYP